MRILAAFLLLLVPATALAQPWSLRREWPKTDFDTRSVALEEIVSGGPPRDGIPAIDQPRFVPVDTAGLTDREGVISVRLGGQARAYPLRILIWHEIVNDEIGGTPVAVTWCPLCNTGIVFQRRLDDGRVLDFGTTGRLRHSDLVMYDRQTESWWQQFTGEAIVGELTGTRLRMLPARLESFARFRARHPEGEVLIPPGEQMRAYGRNPYVGYDRSAVPFLYDGPLPAELPPLARVVRVGEEAWSLDLVRERGRIDTGALVITWEPGQASALDAATVADGFDVGNVVVQRRLPDGRLEDAVHSIDFAFAFRAFFPDAPLHVR